MKTGCMVIAERIHFSVSCGETTQKYLRMVLGFPEKSTDVHLAEYEAGSRTPKADLTAALDKCWMSRHMQCSSGT